MLRHIVMWKFRPGTEAERDLFLTGLQGLYGVIPELKSCRVLRGMEGSDYDAVLISEFENREALERYKNDPRHKAVSALCKSIRTDRRRWIVCCRTEVIWKTPTDGRRRAPHLSAGVFLLKRYHSTGSGQGLPLPPG